AYGTDGEDHNNKNTADCDKCAHEATLSDVCCFPQTRMIKTLSEERSAPGIRAEIGNKFRENKRKINYRIIQISSSRRKTLDRSGKSRPQSGRSVATFPFVSTRHKGSIR